MSVIADIALPCLVLMVVGTFGPFLWTRVLGEGVGRLVVNGVLSVAGCVMAAVVVRALVGSQSGLLGWVALTGLVWVPVVLLALAQQPRRWKEAEW